MRIVIKPTKCTYCGKDLTKDNFGGVIAMENTKNYLCNKVACLNELHDDIEGLQEENDE